MNKTAKALVKLGYKQPELRPHLRPILAELTKKGQKYETYKKVHYEVGMTRSNDLRNDLIKDVVTHSLWALNKEPDKTVSISIPKASAFRTFLEGMSPENLAAWTVTYVPGLRWMTPRLYQAVNAALSGELESLGGTLDGMLDELRMLESVSSYTSIGQPPSKKYAEQLRSYLNPNYSSPVARWGLDQIMDPSNTKALHKVVWEEIEALETSIADFRVDYNEARKHLDSKDLVARVRATCADPDYRGPFIDALVEDFEDDVLATRKLLDRAITNIGGWIGLELPSNPVTFKLSGGLDVSVNSQKVATLKSGADFRQLDVDGSISARR